MYHPDTKMEGDVSSSNEIRRIHRGGEGFVKEKQQGRG